MFQSSLQGSLSRPVPGQRSFGWDGIFQLEEFGLSLSQISDRNLKEYISFRRLAYLKMWLKHFPNE